MEVVPLLGVGPLRFGQTSAEVHDLLGTPLRRLGDTEQYKNGWMVEYDQNDRAFLFQTFLQPPVTWLGQPLLGRASADLIREVEAAGLKAIEEEPGRFYAHKLGLGFMGDPIESIWVYPAGLYNAVFREG